VEFHHQPFFQVPLGVRLLVLGVSLAQDGQREPVGPFPLREPVGVLLVALPPHLGGAPARLADA